ncbi:hypothetical protein N6H14_21680 [Paenibacillus sp. CC-CFT747]|nr:hypothetical protein N6H14_21680 [Paenibacillus sp. CC-CFT747]
MLDTKRKSKGNSLIVLTTSVMAVSLLLSACVKGKGPESQDAGSDPQVDPSNPYKKHLEITWMGHNAIGKIYGETPMQKLIEEKFNVTIKPVPIDIFNQEQVNLYFADGKTADFIRLNGTLAGNSAIMDQGVFKEIPEETLRKFMPNWMKALEGMVDPKIVKSSMYYDGKLYSVPFFNYAQLQPWVMAIRKDWLDNVGITKMPETMEEYHEVLKRFTYNDPDKNGKNDTYGGHGLQLYLKGAFGIGAPDVNYYADKSGKVSATATTDNYKAYLKILQSWYKEGLIDPESITDQRPQQRVKWSTGKIGVLADHPWWYASNTVGNLTKMLTDNNPNAKVEFFKPFAGPDGQKATGNIPFPGMQFGFGFGKDTSDEKIQRIMAIKDYFAADDEFWTRVFYGEEGKGYTRTPEGIIQVTPEYQNVDKTVAEGSNQYFALRPDTWEYQKKNIIYKVDIPAYDIAMNSPVVYNTVNFVTTSTNKAAAKSGAAVNTLVREFETNAMTGKLDIDKEWDAFKKKFLEVGGQAIIDEYQKQYDAVNKK